MMMIMMINLIPPKKGKALGMRLDDDDDDDDDDDK